MEARSIADVLAERENIATDNEKNKLLGREWLMSKLLM
jgi:hypothetical protein